MNPFSVFILIAIVGAIVAMGAVVVSECRDAQLVILPATVIDKAVMVREKAVTTTVPASGCSTCPGGESGGATTVTTIVQEETFYVTLDIMDDAVIRTERVEVSSALYHKLRTGDAVEYRLLRGKTTGRLCGRPEVLVPAPA